MEVTHKTNDSLTAEITIRFEENDYAEDVKKALNEYRRNANIRGFRPGKVPFGMIKNLYGEAVMADTVSKKLGDALDKYLTEQKFNTLGQPLPDDEKQKPVNFKTDKEFSFHYVVGLKPDFDVEINDKIKLNYYDIEIADDAVDKYLMDIRKRFGKQTNPDNVSEGDVVFGTITELDADGNEKKDGISKDVSISVDYIKLKGVKNNFLKLKKGEASIVGFDLHKLKTKQIPKLRRKLGIVFQDFQLLFDRSVRDNLMFVMKATDWKDKKKMEERMMDVLTKVGLETKAHKMPHQLSGGEQQRLSIARALINDPEIILADEPTGNLDPETSKGIMKLLKSLSETGRAVLMATHDYALFDEFPGRLVKFEDGKVMATVE